MIQRTGDIATDERLVYRCPGAWAPCSPILAPSVYTLQRYLNEILNVSTCTDSAMLISCPCIRRTEYPVIFDITPIVVGLPLTENAF
ncbi:hypothetical protein M404DRAFT_1001140, partial [Pisolithus tinctorius Marx 270]